MSEIKTITAELTGKSEQEKRSVYEFINPEGSTYPLKVSAFEPSIPDMKIKHLYTFKCEFVPMNSPGNEGKFYKNFVRRNGSFGKNAYGPYDYQEAAQDAKTCIKSNTDPCGPEPVLGIPERSLPNQPQTFCMKTGLSVGEKADIERTKNEYFRRQEQEQPVREWAIRRGACQHDAAAIVAAIIGQFGKPPTDKAVGTLAKEAGEVVVELTEQLVKDAEKAEAALRRDIGGLRLIKEEKKNSKPSEESVLAGESAEPNTKKVKEAQV